jgi:hypothetical protein
MPEEEFDKPKLDGRSPPAQRDLLWLPAGHLLPHRFTCQCLSKHHASFDTKTAVALTDLFPRLRTHKEHLDRTAGGRFCAAGRYA